MRRLSVLTIKCALAILIGLAGLNEALAQEPSWVTGSVSSSDGVQISYQTTGEGPVSLVFVHGWLCDRTYWREQLEFFAQNYRVVALDLAGHGESGRNRENWTIRAFGHDVASVMEALQLKRVVLIGHSMGGAVVVEAARLAPQNVIGLVGVDTLHDPDAPGMSEEDIKRSVARYKDDFEGGIQRLALAVMFVPSSDLGLRNWIVRDMSLSPPEVGRESLRATLRWHSTTRSEALAALPAPVRLINSNLFPINSPSLAKYGMEVEIMPGVGHFLMLEAPEEFNDLLAAAIDEFAD
ncbi:MAG TPA: alpha/beta hydrolase [Acidobacteriota bacterium]|nr:alpha/beta hydrolase [Acidobacteriota bacterium]